MKLSRKILIGLLMVLVAMQFIRPKRNVSAQTSRNDISLLYPVPANVKPILSKACNDCHSNNTRYPWYSNFQPVAWWLNNHIVEGKHALNFNEFAGYSIRKQYGKMDDVIELVKEGIMPLHSYTSIHTDAKLNEQEKQTLINWAQLIRDTLEAKYPVDSLVRKKK